MKSLSFYKRNLNLKRTLQVLGKLTLVSALTIGSLGTVKEANAIVLETAGAVIGGVIGAKYGLATAVGGALFGGVMGHAVNKVFDLEPGRHHRWSHQRQSGYIEVIDRGYMQDSPDVRYIRYVKYTWDPFYGQYIKQTVRQCEIDGVLGSCHRHRIVRHYSPYRERVIYRDEAPRYHHFHDRERVVYRDHSHYRPVYRDYGHHSGIGVSAGVKFGFGIN